MLFNKPLTDIIRQRKSIRSYTDAPIEEEKKPDGFYYRRG
jgi:nitroreductase